MEDKIYKLKIDVAQGLFEAEGSEEFVKQRFDNFNEIIKERKLPFSIPVAKENSSSDSIPLKEINGKKKPSRPSSFSIVKDLDLRPNDKKPLKEFYDEKAPSTNIETNTVFVYYLEKLLNIKNITVDHIYTCYKEVVRLRVPGNLKQSIVDTASNRYGYLNGADMQDIKLNVRGENLVEHDLPKTKAK